MEKVKDMMLAQEIMNRTWVCLCCRRLNSFKKFEDELIEDYCGALYSI